MFYVTLDKYSLLVSTTQVLSAHSDWLARATGENQNGFPFRFGYREANYVDKRGGCSKKYKNGNEV